ncbi:MAG: Mur ligase domain-containing protein, partial [Planctomycetota bacterium]
MELRLGDIARATGGRLLGGDAHARACGVSTDTRRIVAGECFFAIRGERFDGHRFVGQAAAKGAACAVVDEAAASDLDKAAGACPLIVVTDTTKALADLASHVRASSTIPWVAITGSAGKTTTKELAAAALGGLGPVLKAPASFNNRIGVPLTVLALEFF